MKICVDSGNTLVKIGLIDHNNYVVKKESVPHEAAYQVIMQSIDDYEIMQGILCSVSGISDEIRAVFARPGFMTLTHHTRLPIMNAYQSEETLGLDRIAAVIAAYTRVPQHNHLVISLGTAIVYNHITERGIFRGGAISPGIDMRLKALHHFTHALPLVERQGHYTLVGYDTTSSIRCGAIHGALCEVEGMIADFRKQFPDIIVTITGGDAPLLEKRIKNGIFADSNLILKGLNIIYDYNSK